MELETIKLPFIDFSDLKHHQTCRESVKIQVRQALEEYGCFEAKFDQIPPNLPKSVIDEIKQLFDLPLPVKLRNRSDKPYHGYFGQHAVVPLYESFGILDDDVLSAGKVDAFTGLMWPQGNTSFRESVESFSEQLSELDKIVRKMVLESLGLEKYMDEHMDLTNYLIRVQKYDTPRSHETELGLKSHTDKNIVTILYQNEINGLEFLTKDGRWFPAQPSLDSFIVIIGEAFSAWTNGRLHAPYHRVMMAGDEARYSIGLFSICKPGCIIKAPEEMVDEEHPLLFKPYDHQKFLEFYYTEAGQKSPAALKEYCGM